MIIANIDLATKLAMIHVDNRGAARKKKLCQGYYKHVLTKRSMSSRIPPLIGELRCMASYTANSKHTKEQMSRSMQPRKFLKLQF